MDQARKVSGPLDFVVAADEDRPCSVANNSGRHGQAAVP